MGSTGNDGDANAISGKAGRHGQNPAAAVNSSGGGATVASLLKNCMPASSNTFEGERLRAYRKWFHELDAQRADLRARAPRSPALR